MPWFWQNSQDEAWQVFAEQIGAEFVAGGFRKSSEVRVRIGDWRITLDTFWTESEPARIYTRMRGPYTNPYGFRFTAYPRAAIWRLSAEPGAIGDQEFAGMYEVKSNDEAMARSLFADQELRWLVLAKTSCRLTFNYVEGPFGPWFPDVSDRLQVETYGVIQDAARLRNLLDLLSVTRRRLGEIGPEKKMKKKGIGDSGGFFDEYFA